MPKMWEFGPAGATRNKSKLWQPPTQRYETKKPPEPNEIVRPSPALASARRMIENVAAYSEPVPLLGEAGAGKEHFARRLHDLGNMPGGRFILVNWPVQTK